jgi:hypothetical protein
MDAVFPDIEFAPASATIRSGRARTDSSGHSDTRRRQGLLWEMPTIQESILPSTSLCSYASSRFDSVQSVMILEFVVRPRILKIVNAVQIFFWVVPLQIVRVFCPGGESFPGIIVHIVKTEVVGKFAGDNNLFKKRCSAFRRCALLQNLQNSSLR